LLGKVISYTAKNYTLRQRFQYSFDKIIGRGTLSLLVLIALVTTVLVSALAMLLWFGISPIGEEAGGYSDSFWTVLSVALDPGAVEDSGWAYRLVLLLVAVIGILIVSTLIGIITSGIEHKFELLRRGRSLVLEKGHVVILGWSPKLFSIIEELSIANANQKKACVVVLADRDKVEMEDEIRRYTSNTSGVTIICRKGNSSSVSELRIVNPVLAKSIIILQDTNSGSDRQNLKSCLALCNVFGGDITCPVAVEMYNQRSIDALKRIDSDIQSVRPGNIIARILVQAVRQPGLSDVYDEILSFRGNEIYFFEPAACAGLSVKDATASMQNCSLLGIYTCELQIILNPQLDRVIKDSDKLIVIANDDEDIVFVKNTSKAKQFSTQGHSAQEKPEKVLVLGWKNDALIFMKELCQLLPEQSSIVVMFNPEHTCGPDDNVIDESKVPIETMPGDTADRNCLEQLQLDTFDHVVILGYSDALTVDEADGETLLTLIQVRDLLQEKGVDPNIACELLNKQNRDLLATEKNEDYLASEDLVAKNLVQIAENEVVERVFKTLLTADDCEFHMRSIEKYAEQNCSTVYSDIVARGLDCNEMVIGYRKNGKCILNPLKTSEVTLSFTDAVIVLAEE
jgi:ion channel POLLUX/CASTOR